MLNYPILSDPEKTAATAFGVLNESGQYAQRWTFYVGIDGLIKEIQKKVNARTHGEEVAALVESLGFPKKIN